MSHADKTDHELRPSAVARGVGSALPCPPHALQATREMAAGDSVQCKTSAFQGVLSRVGCAAEGVRKSARCQGPGCRGLRVSLEFLSLGGKVIGDVGAVFAASCSGSQDVTAGSATLAGCRSRRHPGKDFRSTLLVLAEVRRSFGARGHLGAAGLGARRGGGEELFGFPRSMWQTLPSSEGSRVPPRRRPFTRMSLNGPSSSTFIGFSV